MEAGSIATSSSSSHSAEGNNFQDGPSDIEEVLGHPENNGEVVTVNYTPPSHTSILDEHKASKASKRKTSLGHFNTFLAQYWIKLRPEERATEEMDLFERLHRDELNNDLFGCFANYLAKDCWNKTEIKKGNYVPISLNSAVGYFSAIKIFYKEHPRLRNLPRLPRVFDRDQWSNLSNKLTGAIVERHKELGTPIVNPKAAANKEDWKALACICAWDGRQFLLEFWCVFVALTHLAARVNEPAFIKFEHCTTTGMPCSGNVTNIVAQYLVTNYKQYSQQLMHVFPHIELWQLDFFFSQAVFFACSNGTSDYIFPTYGKEGQKESTDSNTKDSSKIVKLFTKALKECKKWFQDNKDSMEQREDMTRELSDGICSHSGKKYAVREMGRELNPVYVIFRAGWEVRNAHTLFDYLVKDVVHDVKAAKICAGWTTKWYCDIWGGYNNKVEDLSEGGDKFEAFCRALFPYQEAKMNREIMLLHGLSVLRFYKDFETCINSRPGAPSQPSRASGNTRTATTGHPFFDKVKTACCAAGVSEDLFAKWQTDTKKEFLQRNCYALSLRDAPNMAVDSKPLLERIEQLTTIVRVNAEASNRLIETCNKLVRLNSEQRERVERLEKLIAAMGRGGRQPFVPAMPTQLQDGEADAGAGAVAASDAQPTLDAHSAPVPISGKRRQTSLCYDTLLFGRYGKKPIPVNQLFVSWFVEQLPVAYDNYRNERSNSQKLTKQEKNYHKSVKTHFSITKTAIHVVVKNLAFYPTGDESPAMLEEMANEALDQIKENHSLPQTKMPSRTLLGGKNSIFKDGYIDKPFPDGTPPEVEAWFNKRGINNSHLTASHQNPDVAVAAEQAEL